MSDVYMQFLFLCYWSHQYLHDEYITYFLSLIEDAFYVYKILQTGYSGDDCDSFDACAIVDFSKHKFFPILVIYV